MIGTKRLWIRRLTTPNKTHVDALNDNEHMRYSEQRHRLHTMLSQEYYICAHEGLLLDICHQDLDTMPRSVGTMAIEFDKANLVANMGIMILPKYKCQGYGKEAWAAVSKFLLTHGSDLYPVDKLEAGMHDDNFAMRDLCMACGWEYEGRRDKHFLNDDGSRSALVMYGRAR